jgi:hypothetical protein
MSCDISDLGEFELKGLASIRDDPARQPWQREVASLSIALGWTQERLGRQYAAGANGGNIRALLTAKRGHPDTRAKFRDALGLASDHFVLTSSADLDAGEMSGWRNALVTEIDAYAEFFHPVEILTFFDGCSARNQMVLLRAFALGTRREEVLRRAERQSRFFDFFPGAHPEVGPPLSAFLEKAKQLGMDLDRFRKSRAKGDRLLEMEFQNAWGYFDLRECEAILAIYRAFMSAHGLNVGAADAVLKSSIVYQSAVDAAKRDPDNDSHTVAMTITMPTRVDQRRVPVDDVKISVEDSTLHLDVPSSTRAVRPRKPRSSTTRTTTRRKKKA